MGVTGKAQDQAFIEPLDNPVVTIKTCHTLNPATLLPTETGSLERDCVETIDTVYTSSPNLRSEPPQTLKRNGSWTGVVL